MSVERLKKQIELMKKLQEVDNHFKTNMTDDYVVDLDIDKDLEYLEYKFDQYIKRGRIKKINKLL